MFDIRDDADACLAKLRLQSEIAVHVPGETIDSVDQDGFDELVLACHPHRGHETEPILEVAAGANILELGGDSPAAVGGQLP